MVNLCYVSYYYLYKLSEIFIILTKIKWYPELEENVKNVPKIFVGNKIDLRDEVMVKKTGKDAPISY